MTEYYYDPRAITAAQWEFVRRDTDWRPKHIVDTSVTLRRYDEMAEAFVCEQSLTTRINYAMKSQAAPELLDDLIAHGISRETVMGSAQFGLDAASKVEIAKALHVAERRGIAAMQVARRITLSNPNMQLHDMDFALVSGVRSFVLHNCRQLYLLHQQAKAHKCVREVEILVRIPGPQGAQRTGGIKFGADPSTCLHILQEANRLGMCPQGIAVHMGWQIATAEEMETGLDQTCRMMRDIWETLKAGGIHLTTLDLGGGWPNQFRTAPVPSISMNARIVRRLLDTYFPAESLQLILEPGNYLSAAAGITKCSIINLDTVPGEPNHLRCVLNAGFFNGGLIDGHYPVSILLDDTLVELTSDTSPDEADLVFSTFGPSCDSVDIVLPKLAVSNNTQIRRRLQDMVSNNVSLRGQPRDVTLILHGTGAYTSEYIVGVPSMPGFNGIYNPDLVVLRGSRNVHV